MAFINLDWVLISEGLKSQKIGTIPISGVWNSDFKTRTTRPRPFTEQNAHLCVQPHMPRRTLFLSLIMFAFVQLTQLLHKFYACFGANKRILQQKRVVMNSYDFVISHFLHISSNGKIFNNFDNFPSMYLVYSTKLI